MESQFDRVVPPRIGAEAEKWDLMGDRKSVV